jgi:phosphoribosyl 1,2-cyclic phosphodiesterase
MTIKYWGVRGSIPSPLTDREIREKQCRLLEKIMQAGGTEKIFGNDPANIKAYVDRQSRAVCGTFGGDTTCLEIQVNDSPLLVIDAGTGARALGNVLLTRMFSGKNLNPLNSNEGTKNQIHLLFTHYHWDHLQGFPFFGPGFVPGPKRVKMFFYGKKDTRQRLSGVLAGQQQYPNFPVVWEDMPCEKSYSEMGRLEREELCVGKARISYQELSHPDSVFAYGVEADGKKFICATDTEQKDIPDPRLVRLAKNADVMYYDAQYDPEGYRGDPGSVTGALPKIEWGHSTYEWGIKNALAANVKTLVLGHHDPLRDDAGIELLVQRAEVLRDEELKKAEHAGKKLEIVAAFQGLEMSL